MGHLACQAVGFSYERPLPTVKDCHWSLSPADCTLKIAPQMALPPCSSSFSPLQPVPPQSHVFDGPSSLARLRPGLGPKPPTSPSPVGVPPQTHAFLPSLAHSRGSQWRIQPKTPGLAKGSPACAPLSPALWPPWPSHSRLLANKFSQVSGFFMNQPQRHFSPSVLAIIGHSQCK